MQIGESTSALRAKKESYKTWIRLLPGDAIKIQYNPDPLFYAKIVQSISAPASNHVFSPVPQINDVLGFLLHEMGHHYDLGEEDAWRFAFELSAALNKIESLEAPAKYCHYHYWDRRDGNENYKAQEDFILDGTLAQKLIRLDIPGVWDESARKDAPQGTGHIWLSHDLAGSGAVLKLSVSPKYGEDTQLQVEARSGLDYNRVFINPRMVGIVLWCKTTPTPGVRYSKDDQNLN